MYKTLRTLLVALILLGIVGCRQRSAFSSARSAKPRATEVDVPGADLTTLAGGNQAFAFDLYRALSKQEGNLFFSPYSISLALGMAYAGARGGTEEEMAGALHFTLPQDRLHPAFSGLDLQLASRGEGAEGKDEGGFRLNIVNAIWGQKDYDFLAEFLDVLAVNYGAGLRLLDFRTAAEAARVTINEWVAEQTEDRIQDLIPPGAINAMTRLVLTNAIYFNAAWQEPFSEPATRDEPFYLLDGNSVSVPMMLQTEEFGYAAGDGYQAVELHYDGRELSMVILLPNEGGFETFERSLTAEVVNHSVKNLSRRKLVLAMPKFEFDSGFSLSQALMTLGMPSAFSATADFSGMTGDRDLFISDVIHKAFVSVDEEGTEAAAATAVVMAELAAPPEKEEPLAVTIDRPFMFLIRDIRTGSVLFVGRVLNPEP
jgi:serpin B